MGRIYLRLPALVSIVLAVSTISAWSDDGGPRVFEDIHQSRYGYFSHWSTIFARGKNNIEIDYAICNLDPDTGLIYKWYGPNITVGDGGRLPARKCHMLTRPVVNVKYDHETTIVFTQAGRHHIAGAHVPKLDAPISEERLPRRLRHHLRMFYGPPMSDAPNIADLVTTEFRNDGNIHRVLSWHPRQLSVAIASSAIPNGELESTVAAIEASGYAATITNLQEHLDNSRGLSDIRVTEDIILISQTPDSSETLEFDSDTEIGGIGTSHLTLLNRETRALIASFEMTVFAAPE